VSRENDSGIDQGAASPTGALPLSTRLALERTRGAYERTLMAWVRTGTSLITFGFAVYKFFQFEMEGKVGSTALIQTALIGTREFGLALISIGLMALLLGAFEHRRDLRALRKDYPGMPRSGSQVLALLVAVLGLLAFVAVVYRY
jgi:putative membrane protein